MALTLELLVCIWGFLTTNHVMCSNQLCWVPVQHFYETVSLDRLHVKLALVHPNVGIYWCNYLVLLWLPAPVRRFAFTEVCRLCAEKHGISVILLKLCNPEIFSSQLHPWPCVYRTSGVHYQARLYVLLHATQLPVHGAPLTVDESGCTCQGPWLFHKHIAAVTNAR